MKLHFLLICLLFLSTQSFSQRSSPTSLHHNVFSLNTYKACVDGDNSLFISPFGIRMLLMAVSEGTAGNTRVRYDSLVNQPSLSETKKAFNEILHPVDVFNATKGTLTVANALFARNTLTLNRPFLQTLQNDYSAEHFKFDSSNVAQLAKDIDSWVSDKTNGVISSMPPPPPTTVMALINAVYFRDKWANTFKRKHTKERTFFAMNGHKQEIDFMKTNANFVYYEDKQLQALKMPYRSQLEMIVILPLKKNGLPEIEKIIDEKYVEEIQAGDVHPTTVFFPKFRLKDQLQLADLLKEVGYGGLFGNIDLTGMSPDSGLSMDAIIHKTFIEVDEKQTEAAAVTEAIIVTGYGGGEPPPPPEPKVFRADHPFMFLIVDQWSGMIVFAGRFMGAED